MRSRVWTATFVALACAAAVELAAQTGGSAATSQTRAPSSSDKVTVTGCIQADQGATGTTGAAGTTGATSTASSSMGGKFILANAKSGSSSSSATGTTGTSGAPSSSASSSTASSYRLDGDDSKLSPHVGHKVEITGTLEPASPSSTSATSAYPSSSSSSSSPKLKVDSVKMIASSCSEQ